MSNKVSSPVNSRIFFIVTVLLLASASSELAVPRVNAAGILLVDPPSITPENPGDIVTSQVRVNEMGSLDRWDIEILTDPTALNATSIAISPDLFPFPPFLEPTHCINGSGIGCVAGEDGPGIVHSSAEYSGISLPQPPLSGVLFTITYKVGNNGFTNIHFITATLTYSGVNVPHSTVDGVYGTPPAPDFTIFTVNTPLTIPPNSRVNATLTLTSQNQFSGKVNLTATVSSPGVSVQLHPTSVPLNNNTANANATISTVGSTPGYYSITIIATSSSSSHDLQIDVTVGSKPDFSIGASPSQLKIAALTSASTTLTVYSENGFAASVNFTLQAPKGVNATLSSSRLFLVAGGTNFSILTLAVPSSTFAYYYLVNITATSAIASHLQTVLVTPPQGGVAISANPPILTVQAGRSAMTTISVTNAFYFVGIVYIQVSMQGGTAKLNNTNAFLDVGKTMFARLNVTVDQALTPGTYVVLLTIYSGSQVTQTHGLTLLVTAAAHAPTNTNSPTIFGLAPTFYLTILGGASVTWAVFSLQSYRRRRKQ